MPDGCLLRRLQLFGITALCPDQLTNYPIGCRFRFPTTLEIEIVKVLEVAQCALTAAMYTLEILILNTYIIVEDRSLCILNTYLSVLL